MSYWKRGSAVAQYVSTDGRYLITREYVPLSCEGPHPIRENGRWSYCEGDVIHDSLRWVLAERNRHGATHEHDMVGVYETLRDAKEDAV